MVEYWLCLATQWAMPLEKGWWSRGCEVGDGALDLDDLVDSAAVAGALGADEADVEGGDLGVFEPGSEEEVAAAQAESADFIGGREGLLLELG
jgi:hypothetical protein